METTLTLDEIFEVVGTVKSINKTKITILTDKNKLINLVTPIYVASLNDYFILNEIKYNFTLLGTKRFDCNNCSYDFIGDCILLNANEYKVINYEAVLNEFRSIDSYWKHYENPSAIADAIRRGDDELFENLSND